METKLHPSDSDLTEYLISGEDAQSGDIVEHLEYCITCQEKLNDMRGTISALKKGIQYSTTDVISYKHVTEDQLVKYVYGELKQEEKDRIERHFEECYLCFKSSLRLKAHIEERKIKNYVVHQEQVVPSIQKDHENEFEIPSKSIKISSYNTMTIAAAIGLLCLTFLLNSYLGIGLSNDGRDVIAQKNDEVLSNEIETTINQQNANLPDKLLFEGAGLQKVNNGVLNWYDGFIETTAVGTVDVRKMANPVQAEIVAEKTARHLAYAQLSEILGGVHITQRFTYNDYLAKDNFLSIKNTQFIQGATIVNKRIEWIDASPKVSVTMRLPLYGSDGVRSLINPLNAEEQNTALFDKPALNIRKANVNDFSGIVLDVRGYNYTPALYVSLKSNEEIIDQLSADYIPTTNNLDKVKEIGKSPHIIKAVTSTEPGQIYVNSQDSATIREYLQHGNKAFAVLF